MLLSLGQDIRRQSQLTPKGRKGFSWPILFKGLNFGPWITSQLLWRTLSSQQLLGRLQENSHYEQERKTWAERKLSWNRSRFKTYARNAIGEECQLLNGEISHIQRQFRNLPKKETRHPLIYEIMSTAKKKKQNQKNRFITDLYPTMIFFKKG